MFSIERFPYSFTALADAVPLDQFPCHRGKHVIVFVDRLKSLARKLSLHGERNEKFLSHQAQTRRLHRSFVAKEFHTHRSPLSDAPGPPACLAQSVQRVTRLVEDDRGKI